MVEPSRASSLAVRALDTQPLAFSGRLCYFSGAGQPKAEWANTTTGTWEFRCMVKNPRLPEPTPGRGRGFFFLTRASKLLYSPSMQPVTVLWKHLVDFQAPRQPEINLAYNRQDKGDTKGQLPTGV